MNVFSLFSNEMNSVWLLQLWKVMWIIIVHWQRNYKNFCHLKIHYDNQALVFNVFKIWDKSEGISHHLQTGGSCLLRAILLVFGLPLLVLDILDLGGQPRLPKHSTPNDSQDFAQRNGRALQWAFRSSFFHTLLRLCTAGHCSRAGPRWGALEDPEF